MPDNAQKIEIKKSSLAPSSIVFFGGNYLGSKLVEKLLEKESRVIVVDKFDSQKENYYINLRNNPKLLIVNCEIEKAIPNEIASCDYVYFLNYQDYYNPVDKFKIVETTQFTKNIINFSLKSQAKVVLVSNVEIKNDFFRKTADTQKLIEEIIGESEESRNLNFRQVRLPILYGPRMSFENSGGLINIIDSYLNKDSISVDDDNNHKNYFLFVDDAVEAIVRSIFSDKTEHKIINVADSEPYSEMEIGSIIKSISPRALDIKYIEENKPIKWVIPEEKNLYLISFAPKTTLRNGLVKTLSYFGHETNTYSFKPEKIAQDNKANALANLRKKSEEIAETVAPKPLKISYERYKSTKQGSKWLPKSKKDLFFKIKPFEHLF
jgi:nucleoside-diphosphate-sugar epimerase